MKAVTNLLWRAVAKVVSQPRVANYLIERSFRTPYFNLDGYMNRWWLFNAYFKGANGDTLPARWSWLPSIRIHHILRADEARDPHNHPWDARTVILRGWYMEQREGVDCFRRTGDTATIAADDFHHIPWVSEGGVWTMFITWKYVRSWGFRTPEGFVPWRDYTKANE